MRINKFLATAGIASRRKVEELILAGRVKVNGEVIEDLGRQVDENNDIVEAMGKRVTLPVSKLYIMMNKPIEVIVSNEDENGRETVFDLLPYKRQRLFSVGRLDYFSEGLILITNDGDFANAIIHPKYKLEKAYEVQIEGTITDEQLQKLRDGIEIDVDSSVEKVKTLPAEARVLRTFQRSTLIELVIKEGKNRQIRQMMDALKITIQKLKRVRIGNLYLGDIEKGKFRNLSEEEIKSLLDLSKGIL